MAYRIESLQWCHSVIMVMCCNSFISAIYEWDLQHNCHHQSQDDNSHRVTFPSQSRHTGRFPTNTRHSSVRLSLRQTLPGMPATSARACARGLPAEVRRKGRASSGAGSRVTSGRQGESPSGSGFHCRSGETASYRAPSGHTQRSKIFR